MDWFGWLLVAAFGLAWLGSARHNEQVRERLEDLEADLAHLRKQLAAPRRQVEDVL
jgi:hypothetical protein